MDKNNENVMLDSAKPVDFSFKKMKDLVAFDVEHARATRIGRIPDRGENHKYLTKAVWLNNNKLTNMVNLDVFLNSILEYPDKLSWLDVSFNRIVKIDPILNRYKNLTIIYLHGNKIANSDEVKKLQNFPLLRSVTLHGNPIAEKNHYRGFVLTNLPQTMFATTATSHSTSNNESAIQKHFSGKTVFITGTTGFIGRILLEKLLRSCPGIEKIYVLLRPKKGKEPAQRFQEIFDVPAFDPLKKLAPNFADKTSIMIGDLTMPGLGLSVEDRQVIVDDVQCIFHCAATVRFDEKIRTAGYINVRAVRDLLRIAKEMKDLTSFIHISTAYAHCPRKDIDECYYAPGISGEKFLNVLESLSDHTLDEITPLLLQDWPNTYTYTKAIAEEVVQSEGNGMPVGIIRPSIILGSYNEPVPGWIDNIYGPTGLAMGAALGVIHTMLSEHTLKADLVPADYVVNATIAASWAVGSKWSSPEITDSNVDKAPPIYNYVNSCQNPIDWGTYTSMVHETCLMFPSPLVIWHGVFFLTSSKLLHTLYVIFLHYLPAYMVDFVLVRMGKEPLLVKAYKKIDKFSGAISYFAKQDFTDNNVQSLWKSLGERDGELFQFNMGAMKWQDFFISYVKGGRLYLLKDSLDTIPQGRRKLLVLKIAHYALVTVLLIMLFIFLKCIFNYIF